LSGHHGAEETTKNLTAVVWPKLIQDVEEFVGACYHCNQRRLAMPGRPWGKQIAPQRRNQIVSFDYVHLGMNEEGNERLLVVTDKLTNFSRFYPGTTENHNHVAKALLDWMAMFGPPSTWLSDLGPGFQNGVIKELNKVMGVKHHFVTAGSHWANGKQERLNLTIANVFRTLLSENGLDQHQWNRVHEAVNAVVNSATTSSDDDLAPIEAFVALERFQPVKVFLEPKKDEWIEIKLDGAEFKKHVAEYHALLKEREVRIHEHQEQLAARRVLKHSEEHGVKKLDAEIGDYVMVWNKKRKSKLNKVWMGPARIVEWDTESPDHVAVVEYLSTKPPQQSRAKVHAKHLRFFDYASMVVNADIKEIAGKSRKGPEKWNATRVTDISKEGAELKLRVEWEADVEEYDPTWEPAAIICEDVPSLVKQFTQSNGLSPEKQQLVQNLKGTRYFKKHIHL